MKFCSHCTEPILAYEDAVPLNDDPRGGHKECVFRMVSGSVGHMRGECPCNGKIDTSEDGITAREAARNSLAEWERHQNVHTSIVQE